MDILSERILCLNKNFYALCIIDAKEAFRLVCANKAVIMDESYVSHKLDSWANHTNKETDLLIRTVDKAFKLPEVIRLISFDKIMEYTLHLTRQNVFSRDSYICQYCRSQIIREKLTIDHVIPRSRKTEFKMSSQEINSWENVVTSCQICNSTKNNRTPEEAGMPLLKTPARPKEEIRGFEYKEIKPSWKLYLNIGEK
jgi:5-methylcytosine-specific restriction endonuclease McrA